MPRCEAESVLKEHVSVVAGTRRQLDTISTRMMGKMGQKVSFRAKKKQNYCHTIAKVFKDCISANGSASFALHTSLPT